MSKSSNDFDKIFNNLSLSRNQNKPDTVQNLEQPKGDVSIQDFENFLGTHSHLDLGVDDQYINNAPSEIRSQEQGEQEEIALRIGSEIFRQKLYMMNVNVEWSWSQFLEYLFYHFMFFFLLGPLSCMFFWYRPGMKQMRNMEFFGNTLVTYIQTFIYMTNVFCSVTFYLYPQKDSSFIEIFYLWILMLNICLIISAKYGTLSEEQILRFKLDVVEVQEKKKLQFLHFHVPQSQEARYVELINSFKRLQHESSMFFVSFIVNVKESLKRQIHQQHNNLSFFDNNGLQARKHHSHYLSKEPLKVLSNTDQFNGFGVLNQIIEEFEGLSDWKVILIKALVLSISLSLIPIWVKIIFSSSYSKDAFQIFYHVFLIIGDFYCSQVLTIFLFATVRESEKKQFMLKQCILMITSSKTKISDKQCFPVINIVDPNSIRGWTMIRKMCLDYGQQYLVRSQAFFSIIFILCTAIFISLALFFFNILDLSYLTLIYIVAWLLFFIYISTKLLISYAYINSYFDKFENQLEDWNNIIIDILRLKKYYFDGKMMPENHLHRTLVTCFQKAAEEEKIPIDEAINNVLIGIEDAQRNLKYDSRNHCIKFYGVKITFEILELIGVCFSSVFGIAFEYWMTQ